MKYIISLNNKTMPNKEILQHVGGKGESLIKMCQAGFPVPEGYVIREDAWDNQGLKKEAGKELYQLIETLSEEDTYAIRSSALGEDGKEHSFAGAYETMLDVPRNHIMAAVEKVALSVNAERVKSYAGNLAGMEGKMSIIIQRYVKPEFAGVLFTADVITGSSAKMVGNYVKGCGEQLVSGEANAVEFTYDAMKYAYHGSAELKPYAKKS